MTPRRAHDAGPAQSLAPVLSVESNRVYADVPVAGNDSAVACRLCLEYRADDPLVVTITLQAPSRAAVAERAIMRADLARARTATVGQAGLVAGPARQHGNIQLVMIEQNTSIGMLLPSALVADFLAATAILVPRDDEAETRALDKALAAFRARHDDRRRTA